MESRLRRPSSCTVDAQQNTLLCNHINTYNQEGDLEQLVTDVLTKPTIDRP